MAIRPFHSKAQAESWVNDQLKKKEYMTPEEFKQKRKSLGLTLAELGPCLGSWINFTEMGKWETTSQTNGNHGNSEFA